MLQFFTFRQQFLPWLVLLVAFVLLVFFACSLRLKRNNCRITSPKLKKPMSIAVLSDLHSSCFGSNQQQLVQMVQKASPDLVVFPGDTIDDRLPPEPALCLLQQLAASYPCLLVFGNHEYRTHQLPALKKQLTNLGVTVLDNRSAAVGPVTIHGLNDPEGAQDLFGQRLQQLGGQVNTENFNILLTHRPERFEEYVPYGFDLVLCGHTHGGQWRLPGVVEGLFATGQGLFPAYVGGHYRKDGCRMIVSRGLSKKHIFIPRIFNRPEVVLVQLVPQE